MVSIPRKRKKERKPTKSTPKKQMTESKGLKPLKPVKHITATDDDAHLIPGEHRQRALEIVKVIAVQLYPNFIPPRDTRKRKSEKVESLGGGGDD